MDVLIEWLHSYRKLMVVDMACELGLFTLLEERPRCAAELAERTGARPVPLEALLDACVGLGLLHLEGGLYGNRAPASAHLVEARPLYLGHLLRVFASEAPHWQGLRGLLLEPSGGQDDGQLDSRRFTLAMHALGVLGEAEALAGSVDLRGRRDLVDVGCGSGIYSVTLCRRYPELRATLMDRPDVLEVTRAQVVEHGLEDRITLRPGDFLRDDYGTSRDVVLLSDVLYLDSAACRAMLGAAHRALAPGGLLVLRGYFSDPKGGQTPYAALFDLDRLLCDPAREPLTVDRLAAWLRDTGFGQVRPFVLTERTTGFVAVR